MKIFVLLCALILAISALKPSEAGVNDWHNNNVGEIRQIAFTKTKVLFTSYLNSIGMMDRYTGKIEQRVVAAQSQKLAGWGYLEMSVATRYNQIVTYSIGQTGINKAVDNKLMNEVAKIESIGRFGKSQFYLAANTLYEGKLIVREAKEGEKFLKIVAGSRLNGNQIAFLAYRQNNNTFCIESYQNHNFLNKFCKDDANPIKHLEIVEGHLLIQLEQSTYILTENLQLIIESKTKTIEVVGSIVVLQNRNFDLKTRLDVERRPLRCYSSQIKFGISLSEGLIHIYREDISLFTVAHSSESNILRAWLNLKSQMDYDLIVQYTDLELVSYSISRGNAHQVWKREESLAYIEDVVFMKFNQMDTLDNQYHRNLISHSYRALNLIQKISKVPRDIVLRLNEEISDFIRSVYQSINYIIDNLGALQSKSLRKFTMSKEQQIRLGLRKYLVAVTKYQTVIAIDTKTKQILWKVNYNVIANSHFVSFVHLKRDYETEVAILVTYSKETSQIYVEEVSESGVITLLKTYSSNIAPSIFKLNQHSLAIKIGSRIHKYGLFQQDDLVQKQYYFYTSNKNQITGWKVIEESVIQIWNFQTRGTQTIMKVTSAFRGDQRARIPLFDKEKVFFKNVDFTNIAVLTSLNHTNLALYIINGRTGKIQFNSYKNNVNTLLPTNLVYDQNNVLVSYFHARNKIYEIWTVQQYQQRFQISAINMISDYLTQNKYHPEQNKQNTIFQTDVYSSPVTIKEMYVSESKMSLTRRNLFIITRQNKLYTINRDLVSTRRPNKDAKSFFQNQKFPEHNYLLPYNPTFYLTYDLTLNNINTIKFDSTNMESSIFVFCYGIDNFLIRTAPDKTFDMITDDFNHLILIVILIAATAAILIFKRQLNLAKLKKPHLE